MEGNVQPRTPDFQSGHLPSTPTTPPPCTFTLENGYQTPANLAPAPDPLEIIDEMQEEILSMRRQVRCLKAENKAIREGNPYRILQELDELRTSNKEFKDENEAWNWENSGLRERVERLSKELEKQCVESGRELEEVKELLGDKSRQCGEVEGELEELKEVLVQKDREIFRLKADAIKASLDFAKALAKGSTAETDGGPGEK